VDRERVSEIVFNDRDELAWLESLTHPRVGAHVLEWRQSLDPEVLVAVVEVPLLLRVVLVEGDPLRGACPAEIDAAHREVALAGDPLVVVTTSLQIHLLEVQRGGRGFASGSGSGGRPR
jgi:hypothetical protein